MDGKDIAAVAHVVALILCLTGTITAGSLGGAETALAAALTSAVGLASTAAVAWKYIHHHADDAPAPAEEKPS